MRRLGALKNSVLLCTGKAWHRAPATQLAAYKAPMIKQWHVWGLTLTFCLQPSCSELVALLRLCRWLCGACHSSSRLSYLVPERSTSYKCVHIRLPALAAQCMQPAGPVHECDRLLGQTRNTVLEQHEQLIAKSKMTVPCRWTICTLSGSVSACAWASSP